ncbi:MAG: PhoU domain-containing protein [Chromatiales bacterium]|jgi:aminoglycoside phosphotransferase
MTMQLPDSITDNLRFLSVEVDSQLANLQAYFDHPDSAIARRILDRAGYAYNLKMRIHSSCLQFLAQSEQDSVATLSLRSIEFIATDLERIAELSRDCIKQMQHLDELQHLQPHAYHPMFRRIRRGIELLEPAILESDTRLALKIGQTRQRIERDYKKLQQAYIDALKTKKHTEDLASALFVAHSVEQMCDALLDISESIISANLGQPLNFERYQSLQDSMEQLDSEELDDVHIETIAETRSGSAISGISPNDNKDDEFVAIFKDGQKRKLKEERRGVKNWHEIYPGLAPKILSYKKRGQSASLLIEHLPGLTFEQILLNESPQLLQETLEQLGATLKSVWRATRTDEPVNADFMQQLEKRLDDVYRIHPEFRQGDSRICGLPIRSFDNLVEQVRAYEANIKAPFSVYIHGDFNLDNIIYDPLEKRINFIDLHRSRYMDYLQDVSVFMVSNYRLQILDAPLRQRILKLAKDFYRMARRYASKVGDETFELRLALGLARSFATSTRFILDKSLARSMFLRARYLIEQVLATEPHKADKFRLPVKEIFVG